MFKRIVVAMVMVICSLALPTLHADMIYLDSYTQGEGNMGESFRPWLDETHLSTAGFVITARTGIDENSPLAAYATGLIGTVYIEKNGRGDTPRGAGVQTIDGGGSKGISGGGGDRDEELIVTYDQAVRLDSITILLGDIEFGNQDGSSDKDDPVLFLQTAGSSTFDVTLTEADIYTAFSQIGNQSDKFGLVDFTSFASLAGLSADTGISAFILRETNGHLYINGVSEGTVAPPVPEPATMGVLLIGGIALIHRRRTRRRIA